ncbi:hypothetical protein P3L10_029579 [Capsicum annuum]
MSCNICHAKGHNKKGYPLATSSIKSSVGSSAAAGTKKGRGRPKGSTKVVAAAGRGRGVTVVDAGKGRGAIVADAGRGRGTDVVAAGRGKGVDVVVVGRERGVVAAGREKKVDVVVAGRGRGVVAAGRGRRVVVVGRGRGVAATATIDGVGRERGPAADVTVGSIGRGRGVTPVADVGRGKGAPCKRPRMVGMGVFQTKSGYKILNPGMPMNSSIVTGHLGHHKLKSGVKWKGKKATTQQDLEVMRAQKRIRTSSNVAEVNYLSQTSSSTFQ